MQMASDLLYANFYVPSDVYINSSLLKLDRVPFLPGDTDIDQLTKIFETLGTPTEETW